MCLINLSFFQVGTKAPAAAGRIHTDFEKGFIMAEVMAYDDFFEHKTETEVKVRGLLCVLWPCYTPEYS